MAIDDELLKARISEARVNGTILDGANGATLLGTTGIGNSNRIPEEVGQRAIALDAEIADEKVAAGKKAAAKAAKADR